jgi:hypothetical protein
MEDSEANRGALGEERGSQGLAPLASCTWAEWPSLICPCSRPTTSTSSRPLVRAACRLLKAHHVVYGIFLTLWRQNR